MDVWLRRSLVGFGLLVVCVLAGITGGFSVSHIEPSDGVTYSDFIVIILTALAVILAALTIFIGILAYLGWNAISRGALQKAEQIIRQELVVGGKLRAVVSDELRNIQYSGVEGLEGGGSDDEDDDEGVERWPNAKTISLAWRRLSESLGDMRFGLDLDRSRLGRPGIEPAATEFTALFDAAGGFKNYFDVVESLPRAIPVLQISAHGIEHMAEQIARAEQLDRGLILRLVHGEVFNPYAVINEVLPVMTDPVVVIDAEWSRDLVSREAWAVPLVRRVLELAEEPEVVLTGSSFPDSFADIDRRRVFPIEERQLFNGVQRHFNESMVYGDWASTRPPRDGGGRGPRRLDLPQTDRWIVFRETGEESYQDLARRMRASLEWPSGLNIWGTYAINSTADGLPGAIKGQEAAASARINIHLHRQALYGVPGEIGDAEEPFTDTDL